MKDIELTSKWDGNRLNIYKGGKSLDIGIEGTGYDEYLTTSMNIKDVQAIYTFLGDWLHANRKT